MAWLAAAATVFSSILQSEGQEDTNDQNAQIQRENSAFNAAEAQKNRDFQQYNSDTVWQRGVQDMQSAGLNPMLAYRQGANPAAAGSMASAGQPGNAQNPYAAAGASATQWAQIENIQADTEKKREEAELTRRQHLGYSGEQEVRVDKMRKEAELVVQQTNLSQEQRRKVFHEVDQVLAQTRNTDADTALKKVNEVLAKHDVPRMKAEAKYFETPVGRTSPHNKYGPQTPFRLLEGLGERVINKFSAAPPPYNQGDHEPATFRDRPDWGRNYTEGSIRR